MEATQVEENKVKRTLVAVEKIVVTTVAETRGSENRRLGLIKRAGTLHGQRRGRRTLTYGLLPTIYKKGSMKPFMDFGSFP